MNLANSQKIKNITSLIDNQRLREEFNLDDEIEKLEMDLQTVEFNYSRSARDIRKTMDKIDDWLKYDHAKTDSVIENCFDKMENRVLVKLVTEKDRIIDGNSLLKTYLSDKSAVFKKILKEQIESERKVINDAESMITKQTGEIKQTLQKTSYRDSKNVGFNPQILPHLKQKVGSLTGWLKKFEETNKTLEKKTELQLKDMMQIFQDIEDSRNDRQAKEEQIILMLEEMSGQNTLQ